MKILVTTICLSIFLALMPKTKTDIDKDDYNPFLTQNADELIKVQEEEYFFWKQKLESAPNQYPYLIKMASAQNALFKYGGKIAHLAEATKLLEDANKMTNSGNASILRMLAKNYISEHRFTESLEVLLIAKEIGIDLINTEKMLFDIYMELGDYSRAEYYLLNIRIAKNNFDYLIRKSKWEDHIGNLSGAIYYMNQALKAATTAKNKDLKQWTLTNLADYYGHNGEINKSYEYYLKALALQPNDAYAKKGIAWILYSHERDTKEAIRIINANETYYHSPDQLLLKAEIAAYNKDSVLSKKYIDAYLADGESNEAYGNMYHKYNIMIYADDKNKQEKALALGQFEVDMRPTAQSYSLLAWAHYKMGNIEKAKEIIISHVEDKTFEPEPLLIMAQILSSDNPSEHFVLLKKELLESIYELGPMAEKKILHL